MGSTFYDATAPDAQQQALAAHNHVRLRRKRPAVWAVYADPTDAPGMFMARLHISHRSGPQPTEFAVCGAKLSDVRACLPPGLHRVTRTVRDDAKLMETWL